MTVEIQGNPSPDAERALGVPPEPRPPLTEGPHG